MVQVPQIYTHIETVIHRDWKRTLQLPQARPARASDDCPMGSEFLKKPPLLRNYPFGLSRLLARLAIGDLRAEVRGTEFIHTSKSGAL